MIELSYLKENERVRFLQKDVQETIQGILQVLYTEYGLLKAVQKHLRQQHQQEDI